MIDHLRTARPIAALEARDEASNDRSHVGEGLPVTRHLQDRIDRLEQHEGAELRGPPQRDDSATGPRTNGRGTVGRSDGRMQRFDSSREADGAAPRALAA